MAVLLVLFGGAFPADGEENQSESERELRRIKQEMEEKKDEIKRAHRKERSVLSELDRIDRHLHTDRAEIAKQQKKLKEAEDALHRIETGSSEVRRDLDDFKRIYGQRLRVLYKTQRNSSAVLWSIPDLGTAVSRMKYLSAIAERDAAIIREYGSTLERYSSRYREIAFQRKDILERQQNIARQQNALQRKKQEKAELLAGVREKKNVYEQTVRELEEASASLWGMIQKDEHSRRATKEQSEYGEQKSESAGSRGGKYVWPVEGKVITRFGMQQHPQFGTMIFRRGIEIEAQEGQQVHAMDSGQVAYADWRKGYGKLIIIDHGKGLYSLYGNLSSLHVMLEDHVEKGRVIGLAGDTGSLKGAKLYFEIRRNGKAQDPFQWLAQR